LNHYDSAFRAPQAQERERIFFRARSRSRARCFSVPVPGRPTSGVEIVMAQPGDGPAQQIGGHPHEKAAQGVATARGCRRRLLASFIVAESGSRALQSHGSLRRIPLRGHCRGHPVDLQGLELSKRALQCPTGWRGGPGAATAPVQHRGCRGMGPCCGPALCSAQRPAAKIA
jgi:hypothetical protein